MKTWTKNELPTRAVPLGAPAVLAFSGLFWAWKEFALSAGILLAFDLFLRTGELFCIRRSDVEFFPGGATVQLLETKSSARQIHSERLLVWDKTALQALRFLCRANILLTGWSTALQCASVLCGIVLWLSFYWKTFLFLHIPYVEVGRPAPLGLEFLLINSLFGGVGHINALPAFTSTKLFSNLLR